MVPWNICAATPAISTTGFSTGRITASASDKKRKKGLAFSGPVCYHIGAEGNSAKIRVWRSLVSRLNGVQEALSSNLSTRTKTTENNAFSVVFLFEKFSDILQNGLTFWSIANLLQIGKPPKTGRLLFTLFRYTQRTGAGRRPTPCPLYSMRLRRSP